MCSRHSKALTLVHPRDLTAPNSCHRAFSQDGTARALCGRGDGHRTGAGAAQCPCGHAHVLTHSSLLPRAAGDPAAVLALTAAPSSTGCPAPREPLLPQHRNPAAPPDSSKMLPRYFYPAVAIETSDPLAVMQPLSEALHHQLLLTTHGAGGRYFGQSPSVAGDNPAPQDSLAWGDQRVQQKGGCGRGEDSSVSEPWSLQPITQPCHSLSPGQD